MNVVTFPGLNLKFEISKIAFSILGISVYKYAVCIVVGIVIALILCKFSKEKFGVGYDDVLVGTILGIVFGTIGARFYYVIFNFDYYLNNISQIFNFRNGGLAIYGGLILGALVICVYCKKNKIVILNFLDYVIPYIAIAQSIGRWGNFFNVEAYGQETTFFLRMGINTSVGYQEVHPTFLYESFSTLLIFIILKFLQKKRKFQGEIFIVYCLLYSAIRALLESMRTDSLLLFNFKISQILSLIILSVSLIIITIKFKKIDMSKKK